MTIKRIIIIPTYNEIQNIEKLVNELLCLSPEFEILVIDDNSPDGTAAVVKNKFSGNNKVSLITRPAKIGLGSAYMEGFRRAVEKGCDRVFTMDADFSHQPKYLPELDAILEKNDLAIGSRYVEGGGVEGWPAKRKLLSRFGNIYARTVIGLPVRDCTSGFMGINRGLVKKFLASNISSEGYSFLIELKRTAVVNGFSAREMPIIFIDRIAGVSKISKKIIIEAFLLAIKLRFAGQTAGERGNQLFKLIDRYAGIPLVWALGVFSKKEKKPPENPREILVIKLSALGDSILLIPSLRALRQKYPGASISVLCTRINNVIFENCAYVNRVILCDVKKIAANPTSIFSLFEGKKYDLAVDFDQWLRLSPLLALLSGARTRIGFKTEGQFRHYSYSAFIEHNRKEHEVTLFLELLSLLGINYADSRLEFQVTEAAEARARELFKMILMDENKPFVVLHPETPQHAAQRHWPKDRYIELGKKIISSFHFNVLVTGTKNELSENIDIVSSIGPSAKIFPPADILTVAAALAKAKAVVCGNTGIMHLACALGRPVVAIHGPTDPVKWGPRGEKCRVVKADLSCSPCLYLGFEYKCPKNTCMEAVSVEDVFKNIHEVAFSS